jgi:hypothetical protein
MIIDDAINIKVNVHKLKIYAHLTRIIEVFLYSNDIKIRFIYSYLSYQNNYA